MPLVQELLLKTTSASPKDFSKILQRSGVLSVRCYEGTSHVLSEEAPLCFFYWLQIAAKTVFALPPSFLEAIRNTTNTFHMSVSFSSVMFLWAREVCSIQC